MHITPELLERHERPGPRYTSYPTALEFHPAFGPDEYIERLEGLAPDEEISLYLHLPFCTQRCLYCACNVVIDPGSRVADPYLERLFTEIDLVSAHLKGRPPVTQLHFGGGTPTFYRPEQLRALLRHLRERFHIADGAEIAIEVDPRVTTDEHLEVLVAEGINRLSIGVQDFDETVQQTIHRVQPVALVAHLMEHARALGIESINLDLIYGLPHQTLASFGETLDAVVALRPDRLATYSFAFVPWMKGHQKKLPQEHMPTGQEKLALLALASEKLTAAGYHHIGMDHFALASDELFVAQDERRLWRNFMGYTTSRADQMIGLGLSSIGLVGDAYAQNAKNLKQYMDAVDAGRLPTERGLAMTQDDLRRAYVIREIMCHASIDKDEFSKAFPGHSFEESFADALPRLDAIQLEGLIEQSPSGLKATPVGRLFVRNVAMVFDQYLQKKLSDKKRFSSTV